MATSNIVYESLAPLHAPKAVPLDEDQLWTEYLDARERHTELRGRSPISSCSSSSGAFFDDDQCSSSAQSEPDPPKSGNFWIQDRAERAQREFLLSLSSNRRQPSPAPTPSRSIFNPYAAPFLPASARATQAPTQPPVFPVPLSQQHTPGIAVKPKWLSMFRAGSATADHVVRRSYAQAVARAGPWDADALRTLAEALVQRATEGYGPQLASVAPFARAVYDAFAHAEENGAGLAEDFRQALVFVVSQEFDAWWQSGAPTAIANTTLEKTQAFLASALAIATFVAHLYVAGLVPAAYVFQCLEILVCDMCMIEELHAVHAIISHSNATLCEDVQTLALIVRTLTARAALIHDGASALGQAFNQAEVQAWVQEICQLVQGWHESLVDSSPRPAAAPAVPPGLGYDELLTPTTPSHATVRAPTRPQQRLVYRTYSEAARVHT